jgi:hypothetical protein
MDKTLEVILVATVLVVAAVILVGLLQGRAGNFGQFADNQTSSASCGISQSQFASAIDCDSSDTSSIKPKRAEEMRMENKQDCAWADGTSAAYNSVCD